MKGWFTSKEYARKYRITLAEAQRRLHEKAVNGKIEAFTSGDRTYYRFK